MENLFTLLSPTVAFLTDLGAPLGFAVGVVVLAAGVTTGAAHAWFRR